MMTTSTSASRTALETVPQEWSTDRDESFFRVTANMFPANVAFAAGVLLASYDPE